jgi:hypothetical protein
MTIRSGLAAVLPLALLLLTALPARAGEEICAVRLPSNIDAGILGPEILEILSRSETFRRQCQRIAATRVLRVRLGITSQPAGEYRAVTILARYDAGALRADVTLVFADNYVELLAHEFEHVLEQIDGVNLRIDVARGHARLLQDGTYETRRATEAGLQVLREYEAQAPRLRSRGAVAFGWRCIPPGGVAPPSHAPGVLGRPVSPAGRIAALAATPDS